MKNNKRRKKLDDSNFRLIKLIKKNSFPILIVILILCTLTLIGVNIFYGNSVNIEDKEIVGSQFPDVFIHLHPNGHKAAEG